MEHINLTLHYTEGGDTIVENFASAIGAMGRVGALVDNGIGHHFAIYSDGLLLMEQDAIFKTLKIARH